ncbi:hypothetical protein D0T12_15595 [Actinomadura spongiicola]|uniref:Uncharacterized protein n=1 Tax=Actinomadura spongiicola TaxID=2303421 RepID=A0A372GHR9_9ACTN|nr:hypothetical protein [Actinomadura spongiicola]RFS84926.1 hypothetical protein D0T12_15595 [Actinomadura spongiicola]
MRYEVENSGLDPEELKELGDFERADRPTGERGPATDVLVAVAANVASVGVTGALTATWIAYRGRRERALRPAASGTMRVEIVHNDGSETSTIVHVQGHGAVELHGTTDLDDVRILRVVFPEEH